MPGLSGRIGLNSLRTLTAWPTATVSTRGASVTLLALLIRHKSRSPSSSPRGVDLPLPGRTGSLRNVGGDWLTRNELEGRHV